MLKLSRDSAGTTPNDFDKQRRRINETKEGGTRFQRLLDYEIHHTAIQSKPLHEIKLPSKIKMSPYAQQSVISTPITASVEMHEWLQNRTNQIQRVLYFNPNHYSLASPLQDITEIYSSLVKQEDLRLYDQIFHSNIDQFHKAGLIEVASNRKQLYWTFYTMTLDIFNTHRIRPKQNEIEIVSLLLVSIECVNMIIGLKNGNFDKLIAQTAATNYQIWVQLDFLLNNLDQKCPPQVKEHILDIETKFISYYVWTNDTQSSLLTYINQLGKNELMTEGTEFQVLISSIKRFFRRVLHYCAYQIQTICDKLMLPETTSERVWQVTKYVINDKPSKNINKSKISYVIDLLIKLYFQVCGSQSKFQIIINAYEMSNQHFPKSLIKTIICQVYLGGFNFGDIVSFYNQVFIGQTKSFILQIAQQMKSEKMIPQSPITGKNPAISQNLLQSPLRYVIPQAQCTPTSILMTPATKLLYAYQESPLMKIDSKIIGKENMRQNHLKSNTSDDNQGGATDFLTRKLQQVKNQNAPLPPTNKQFSILSNGTPKPPMHNNTNSTQNNHSGREKTQESGNSTYCKLLNFES